MFLVTIQIYHFNSIRLAVNDKAKKWKDTKVPY